MGLGLLGGALNDAIFLLEHGAKLTITDLKSEEELKPSLDKLKKYQHLTYVLGQHRLEDFQQADFILQPGNVPFDSPYLAEAKKHRIPIYVSESLFMENLPAGVQTIGITGTRGKSTTTQLIYEILRNAFGPKKVFLAGNVKNVSTLALLDQVKAGDWVVLELDSWALHGLGDLKLSPHLAVFTNFMADHQNFYGSSKLAPKQSGMDLYFADKANIFLNQTAGDYLICGAEVLKLIQKKYRQFSGRAIVPDVGVIPKGWKIKLLGEHNRQNIACAVTAARVLDIPEKTIKSSVEGFLGVPGRLELVRDVRGVRYYNDTTATTPDAVLAALRGLQPTLKGKSDIVLISGGTDKSLDYVSYAQEVSKNVKRLILFKGSATDKITKLLPVGIDYWIVDDMKKAVDLARNFAKKNDVVLLSPGAASFGIFKNEFDRGEQFVQLIKKIK